jgi:retinol-binding protein 3
MATGFALETAMLFRPFRSPSICAFAIRPLTRRTFALRIFAIRVLALSMALATVAPAQPSGPQQDRPVTADERASVIAGALDSLQRHYFSRSTAQQATSLIQSKQRSGRYDTVTSANALARVLSEDLQAATHDLHVRVLFSAEPIPPKPTAPVVRTAAQLTAMKNFHARRNFGLVTLSRLPGNVGYMDLRAFADTSVAADAIANAMTFLASTDALIIDLRSNRGGEPEMQALLSSYFLPSKTLLSTFTSDDPGRVHENWTVAVSGPQYLAKPLYVLTSAKTTFSAAEGFSYIMQSARKATIVGERTGGGTNPSDGYVLSRNFAVLVPYATPIVPATGANWSGGVKPDMETSAANAQVTAHLAALEMLLAHAPGDLDGERRGAVAELRRQLSLPPTR